MKNDGRAKRCSKCAGARWVESNHREPGDSLFIRAVSVAGLSYVRPIIGTRSF